MTSMTVITVVCRNKIQIILKVKHSWGKVNLLEYKLSKTGFLMGRIRNGHRKTINSNIATRR